MITIEQIREARNRLVPYIKPTPFIECFPTEITTSRVYLKMETVHRTGSFKERGALNRLFYLKANNESAHGVVATSAGNHAQSLAYHGKNLGVPVTVVMPKTTPNAKIVASQQWGAKIILDGDTFAESYDLGQKLAQDQNVPFISAYDDEYIIAGQGTCGLEIASSLDSIDAVIVPVGGGGLASGVAIAVKDQHPSCHVIGVQTDQCPYVAQAVVGNKIKIPDQYVPTIADGIAVKGLGHFTIPVMKKYLDDMVLVSDAEIVASMMHILERHKTLVEGAGAAAYAALIFNKVNIDGFKNVVVILSGGNADLTTISRVIKKGLLKTHRLAMLSIRISDRPGGLAALTQLFAKIQASVVQIHHERASSHIPMFETTVDVSLELKGSQHFLELTKQLTEHGYAFVVRD